MPPPWAETPSRVVVEWNREGGFGSRKITYRHSAEVLPAQLHGRVAHQVWAELMRQIIEVGKQHPYTQKVGGGRMLEWFGAAVMASVVGFCCANPDGGEYGTWLPEVNAMISRQRPFFSQAGCALSLQHAQGSYWVQIDVDQKAMAMGQPVMAPGGVPAGPGLGPPPAAYPGYSPPPPAGYAPPQYQPAPYPTQ